MFVRRSRIGNVVKLLKVLFPSAVFNVDGSVSVPEDVVLLLARFASRFGSVGKIRTKSPSVLSLTVYGEEAVGSVWGGSNFVAACVIPRGVSFPAAVYVPVPSLGELPYVVWDIRRILHGLETSSLSRSLEALEELYSAPPGIELESPFIVPFLILVRSSASVLSPEETNRIRRTLQPIGVEEVLIAAPANRAKKLVKEIAERLSNIGFSRIRGGRMVILGNNVKSYLAQVLYPETCIAATVINDHAKTDVQVQAAPRFFKTYNFRVKVPAGTYKIEALFNSEENAERVIDSLSSIAGASTLQRLRQCIEKTLRRGT